MSDEPEVEIIPIEGAKHRRLVDESKVIKAYLAGKVAQAEEDAKIADEIAERAYWQTIGGVARGEAAREIAAIIRGNAAKLEEDGK